MGLIKIESGDTTTEDGFNCDDETPGEILPVVAFLRLIGEVFESFIDDLEVGLEELYVLQRGDADLPLVGSELNLVVPGKDAELRSRGFRLFQPVCSLLGTGADPRTSWN